MEEVEERGSDEVVEVGDVDGGPEGGAGRNCVEGAVRSLLAEVADAVAEVGAVEAVAGEAGGGAGQADPGVLDAARPAVGAVQVHAGDLFVCGPLIGEAVLEVVALQRVADRDQGDDESCDGTENQGG